jgi:hypothetical protein
MRRINVEASPRVLPKHLVPLQTRPHRRLLLLLMLLLMMMMTAALGCRPEVA